SEGPEALSTAGREASVTILGGLLICGRSASYFGESRELGARKSFVLGGETGCIARNPLVFIGVGEKGGEGGGGVKRAHLGQIGPGFGIDAADFHLRPSQNLLCAGEA